jgi:hypothetical protein
LTWDEFATVFGVPASQAASPTYGDMCGEMVRWCHPGLIVVPAAGPTTVRDLSPDWVWDMSRWCRCAGTRRAWRDGLWLIGMLEPNRHWTLWRELTTRESVDERTADAYRSLARVNALKTSTTHHTLRAVVAGVAHGARFPPVGAFHGQPLGLSCYTGGIRQATRHRSVKSDFVDPSIAKSSAQTASSVLRDRSSHCDWSADAKLVLCPQRLPLHCCSFRCPS